MACRDVLQECHVKIHPDVVIKIFLNDLFKYIIFLKIMVSKFLYVLILKTQRKYR
jgi:hypothetical protein